MSLHPQYMRAAPLWRKCRDAVAGQEAVHAAGETYLPRLSGQSPAAYEAYRNRALFYNATRRTLDGLVGLLFRRPPLVEVPAGAEALARDADLSGRGLEALGRTVTREVLTTGRCGMLVDFPRLETAYTTAAQAEAAGARPFLRLYPAEAILEWTTASVNTVPTLVHLMLSEAEGQRRRILSLTDEGYVQDVQQRDETGHWRPAGKTMIPRMNGAPMERIPFVFAGPRESRPEVADPPLLDLVNVNLSHYRTTADLEHGAHFTGLPTAVITGHTPAEGENLSIGGNAAWVLPRPEAKAYFLECKGEGLSALERLLDRKEAMMAAIGARMLAADKRAAESAQAEAIRRAGEQSALTAVGAAVSEALSQALEWMVRWAGLSGRAGLSLNTDFLPLPMSAAELTAHVHAWQAGSLSDGELFDALKAGEIIRGSRTFEEHAAETSAPLDTGDHA